MIGSDKQAKWAESIKTQIMDSLSAFSDSYDIAEIEKVQNASWWIDRRELPINIETLSDLISCAWIENSGVHLLDSAGESKVASGLRNGGTLEPLKYSFGSMSGQTYTHLLTLSNGHQFVVNKTIANSFSNTHTSE